MNDMIEELNHLDKMLSDKDGRKETKFHEEVLRNVQEDFGEKESEKIRDMVLMACEMGACLVCDHAVKVLVAQIHLLVKPVFSVVLFF